MEIGAWWPASLSERCRRRPRSDADFAPDFLTGLQSEGTGLLGLQPGQHRAQLLVVQNRMYLHFHQVGPIESPARAIAEASSASLIMIPLP